MRLVFIAFLSVALSAVLAKTVEPISLKKAVEPVALVERDHDHEDAESRRENSHRLERQTNGGDPSSELEAAFERLKDELAEVELMKAEMANIAGGNGDAMAALANSKAANEALRKELNELKADHNKLAGTDAGQALKRVKKVTTENDNLRAEHSKMKQSLASLAEEAASLQVFRAAPTLVFLAVD